MINVDFEDINFEVTSFAAIGKRMQLPQWLAEHIDPAAVVTSVGAWCSIGPHRQMRPERKYFPVRIDEFVDMSNGERVSVRWDRGVTVSWDAIVDEDAGRSEAELLFHPERGLLPDEGKT
ncbi:hypothetical protein GCM10023166_29650 [Paeniglutamicibacter cryotolerans]